MCQASHRGRQIAMGREALCALRGVNTGHRYDARAVDQREEDVVLETDRYRITGKLTLPREGYRSRLSDYVNQRDREFFVLSDATLRSLDGSDPQRRSPFLMIARSHVRLIAPVSDEFWDQH